MQICKGIVKILLINGLNNENLEYIDGNWQKFAKGMLNFLGIYMLKEWKIRMFIGKMAQIYIEIDQF